MGFYYGAWLIVTGWLCGWAQPWALHPSWGVWSGPEFQLFNQMIGLSGDQPPSWSPEWIATLAWQRLLSIWKFQGFLKPCQETWTKTRYSLSYHCLITQPILKLIYISALRDKESSLELLPFRFSYFTFKNLIVANLHKWVERGHSCDLFHCFMLHPGKNSQRSMWKAEPFFLQKCLKGRSSGCF